MISGLSYGKKYDKKKYNKLDKKYCQIWFLNRKIVIYLKKTNNDCKHHLMSQKY